MNDNKFKAASRFFGIKVTPENFETVLTQELISKSCLTLMCDGFKVDVFSNHVIIYKIEDSPDKLVQKQRTQVSRSQHSNNMKLNFIEAIGGLVTNYNKL